MYKLATIAMGPLLLIQGRRVRRDIPRLPEASGERDGLSGRGPTLRVLMVGDSAAAGVGAETQSDALAGRLVAELRDTYEVSWKLIAHTGFTARQTLARLQKEDAAPFDVVITSIGVNDVTRRTSVKEWLSVHEQLIELCQTKFKVRHIVFCSVPPMERFPALPAPLNWYLGKQAQAYNQVLRDKARDSQAFELAAVNFPVNPELMAVDGFHPGPQAYKLWAEYLAKLIRRRW